MKKGKYPTIKLKTHDNWFEDQCYVEGNEAWQVETLWDAAADLPAYEVPLIGFCTDIQPWDSVSDNYLEYLSHVKLIMNADLSYPLILTPGGGIADGRHRLGRAIVEGHTTIMVKRLDFMPDPDYTYDEDGDPVEV